MIEFITFAISSFLVGGAIGSVFYLWLYLKYKREYATKCNDKKAKNTCEAFASFEQAIGAIKLFASSVGLHTKDIINAMKRRNNEIFLVISTYNNFMVRSSSYY